MLSACSSINRGMQAALAAERAADRDMMVRVVKHETRSRDQHAALEATSDRLARQGDALQRQEVRTAYLATALAGPGGLQERLADIHYKLQGIAQEMTPTQTAAPGRTASALRSMSVEHLPK